MKLLDSIELKKAEVYAVEGHGAGVRTTQAGVSSEVVAAIRACSSPSHIARTITKAYFSEKTRCFATLTIGESAAKRDQRPSVLYAHACGP